jgi:transcriptional regulator with XRE-family HTH domain
MVRKYKATKKTIKIILDAIGEGLSQREAASLAGISEDTLSLWKKDSEFSEQIRQKQIECKLGHIRNIKKASEKSWQASAWWLERKHKEEFSLKTKLDVEVNENLNQLTDKIKLILTPAK